MMNNNFDTETVDALADSLRERTYCIGDRTVVEIDVCPSTAEQLETIGEQNIPWPSNDDSALLRETLSRTNSGFSVPGRRGSMASRAVSFERGVTEIVRKLSPPRSRSRKKSSSSSKEGDTADADNSRPATPASSAAGSAADAGEGLRAEPTPVRFAEEPA